MTEWITNTILSWELWQLVVTAAIPIAVHNYGRTTTTMNAINELREKSANIWKEILVLPKDFEQLDQKGRHELMNYLNEYDHFCTLFNEGLISKRLVRKTRRTTIVNAYQIHADFIKRWREEYDQEAWKNLEICARKLQ